MISGFDTTRFRQEEPATWRHPRSGDMIRGSLSGSPLNEPVWLEDVPAMQRNLAREYAASGCLIEAVPVQLGGDVPAVYQLAKFPAPTQPGVPTAGMVYTASVYVAKASGFALLQYFAAESGTTGMREARLVAQLGMSRDLYPPHPYDPGLESAVPYNGFDDPIYDTMFPDHPLSRVRAWAARSLPAVVVDPAFAGLADFVPSLQAHAQASTAASTGPAATAGRHCSRWRTGARCTPCSGRPSSSGCWTRWTPRPCSSTRRTGSSGPPLRRILHGSSRRCRT
ncbi:hypothetical protein [Micromonospora sp. NBC_01655]|uniref:hypothetical protein n=1 Tax=Micromonospora sp. NBC_01655 TaxID=2975983 RepID=UPI002B1CABCE|nr:hypothetical protein [Micromonospora sp. NBC_01655]